MPIEFSCSSCARQLRTPDESAGKRARCPQCGALVDVPPPDVSSADSTPRPAGSPDADSPTSPFGPGPTGPTTSEPINPYASPESFEAPVQPEVAKGQLTHREINFDTTLRDTWAIFQPNMGPLALLGVIMYALNFGLGIANQIGAFVVQLSEEWVLIVGFFILNTTVGMLVQTYLKLVTIVYVIKITRTRLVTLNDAFLANRFFVRGLGLTIVLALIFLAVLFVSMLPALISIPLEQEVVTGALLVVGGILSLAGMAILWFRYLLSFYFLVDRDTSIGESLSYSAQYMRGNKLTAFLVILVVGFIGFLFVCFTLSLGQILYLPYYSLLLAVIYLSATGQPWLRSSA